MKTIPLIARAEADAGRRRIVAVGAVTLLLVGLMGGAVALSRAAPGTASRQLLDADGIYDLTNIWTIHLTFAPDQWEAMEPDGGGNPFGPREASRGARTMAPVVNHDDVT